MTIETKQLQGDILQRTTYQPQELVPERYCAQPDYSETDTALTRALLDTTFRFLRAYSKLGQVLGWGVIERIRKTTTEHGILDDQDEMWMNFIGRWCRLRDSDFEVPLQTQAELATDLIIGLPVFYFLKKNETFYDEDDLIVHLGAAINKHISHLHYENGFQGDLKELPFSKKIYNYFIEDPDRFSLFTEVLNRKLKLLGIDPMIGNIRLHYDSAKSVLSWGFSHSGVTGGYSVKYNPSGNHELSAICGPDGSGKTTILNNINMVVLPIAHPEDPRMKRFFESFEKDVFDYNEQLRLFQGMRKNVLRRDLALVAYRFVRNLLAYLDKKYSPLTIFQGIILDRSSLTNIAYTDDPRNFGIAVSEFAMDFFLHPRTIIAVDTPVSIAFSRATQDRESPDEFDTAEKHIFRRRATMYQILASVLPNVVSLRTYDPKRDEIIDPKILAKLAKEMIDQRNFSLDLSSIK